jgi:hypothetical protein
MNFFFLLIENCLLMKKVISMFSQFRLFALGIGLFTLGLAGCGAQQFSPANRELLKPLQTAVSAKKPEWVDATEKLLLAQREAGNVADPELKAFAVIIKKTRAGDWKGAQVDLNVLIDSQRATSADIARLKEGQRNTVVAEHQAAAKKTRKP